MVSGLSKIAGLPQMKAAWIAVTGRGREQGGSLALERLEVIADTFLSMKAPVQLALPAWLTGRHSVERQILARVSANLAELDCQLKQVPAVERLAAEGGWYAVLRIPALDSDERTVLRLLDCGVWVQPGSFFGMPPSGWLIVSLLCRPDEFSTGVTRLVDYFRTNQPGNIAAL